MIDAVDFLRELVAIPSVSGEEATAVAHLVNRMNELGLSASVDEAGNAVGVRECADANGAIEREIVLLGHIDTVPGEIEVRVANGRLYGRGSVDAKGPLATFVMAAAQAQLPPGTRVVVIGAVEEESATSKGARFTATQYQPTACIIGEPSGWDAVTLGYKGRLLLDYVCERPMAHTAGKEEGVGETAVAFWNAITTYAAQFNQGRERLFDQLLPCLRHIQTSSDGLINRAEMKIGLRLPPEFDVDGFMQQFPSPSPSPREGEDLASPLSGETGEGVLIRIYGYEPAFQSDRRQVLTRQFSVALRQAGVRPRFKLKTGTADMNVVGPVWNCPIVAYGPGDSQLDHTPNEHVVIAEYLQAIELLRTVLENGER
jgi:LysW-gamma-L-lysine carboxypeptidase